MPRPDLQGERRTVSSGKTLSSFVRSAVHDVDSLRARPPFLFDRRVFPTTPLVFCCFSVSPTLSVHASYHARYAPHLVSLQKSPCVSSRSRQCPLLPSFSIGCLCSINAPPLSLRPCPASARTSSPFLFHPIHPRLVHFLDLSSSRFNHRASIHFCFSDPLHCHCLSFSVSNRREYLSSTSLFAPCLPPTNRRPLLLSITLSMPRLFLSFSLPLAISHQLTHTLRRRQAPVPCGLVLRARGCCEIIVSPRPSRNQSPSHPTSREAAVRARPPP